MRVLRSILLAFVFIAGVFVASANVHLVELVLMPDLGIDALPRRVAIDLPLFLVVIAALAAGVLLGGLAAALEQVRLRRGLRRARRERDRAVAEQGKADALLDGLRTEADALRAQVEELSSELASARVDEEGPFSPFVAPDPDAHTVESSEAAVATKATSEDAESESDDDSGPKPSASRSD